MKCLYIYNLFYSLLGVKFGKKVKLQGIPVIAKTKKAKITLENNVTIKSSLLSNLIGLYQRSIIVARASGAVVEIGEGSGLSGVTIYARECIKIGKDCRIGANTKIFDNDFHPVEPTLRLEASNKNMKVKPVLIGDNVFIGCNSIILKGTTIGDNTTIGVGSVVSGNIPANCVAAGNPAKVIRYFENE